MPTPCVYGGVEFDLLNASDCIDRVGGKTDSAESQNRLKSISGLIVWVVDLPFSAVADTFILPVALYSQIKETTRD
jgi:uncharacterized protein YceK